MNVYALSLAAFRLLGVYAFTAIVVRAAGHVLQSVPGGPSRFLHALVYESGPLLLLAVALLWTSWTLAPRFARSANRTGAGADAERPASALELEVAGLRLLGVGLVVLALPAIAGRLTVLGLAALHGAIASEQEYELVNLAGGYLAEHGVAAVLGGLLAMKAAPLAAYLRTRISSGNGAVDVEAR